MAELNARFSLEQRQIRANFSLEHTTIPAIFKINAAGTTWGSISGNIQNQGDLYSILQDKASVESVETLTETVQNNYDTLDGKIDDTESALAGQITALSDTVNINNQNINNRVDNVTLDVSANTDAISTINNTISGYGNIVTHNVNEFATAAQGALADSALQPGDNISELTNDVGYITSASLPTLEDLTTQAQLDAINSGATATNIRQITTNENNIADIRDLIPNQATSSNQLADKAFVNSSIATNTAYFIGTFNSVAELEAYSGPLTNNDYAFVVGTDTAGNTVYDRYKYNADTQQWIFEYELNNSSFTAAQWNAINSGITSDDVSLIQTALQPNDNISELVNDAGYITSASLPTVNNGTLDIQVNGTSIGTFTANQAGNTTANIVVPDSATWGNITGTLSNQTDLQDALDGKQDVITDLSTIRSGAGLGATALQPNDNISELVNNVGYITGITSSDVTTALGYTPYNSTNPNGYISGITSLDVTTALGYTPLPNATKYGADLSYSSNTLQLLDQDGNDLGNPVTIQSSPDIDNKSITTNISDELQTVGVIDSNNTTNAIKTWTGTKAEYDAIASKDANTLYNVTDDTDVTIPLLELLYPVGSLYIATANVSVCPLSVLGVGTWQLKANSTLVTDINSTAPVVGNGMAIGLTNGSNNYGLATTSSNNLAGYTGAYGQSVGGNLNTGSNPSPGHAVGITTDPTKSGIQANITSTTLSVTIWERIS